MAGGWDEKVSENVEYLEELKRLADKSFVKKAVLFMPSISDEVREGSWGERCQASAPPPEGWVGPGRNLSWGLKRSLAGGGRRN